MKITAPLSRVEEVVPLAQAGADELYCGLVPAEWVQRFGSSGVNRRLFSNLPDHEALHEVVRRAHDCGVRVSLVLNAQHYSGEQLPMLLELCARFDAMAGDAAIVGDAVLLGVLAGQGFRFRLHVSSIATCRNSEAARFQAELGAHRLILPRHVTLGEIEAIARAVPALEIEAFVLNDGCVFEEGVCHTLHLPQRLGGPICMDDYRLEYRRLDGRALTAAERASLEETEAQYRSWLWYRFGCGFSVTAEGYPYGPCGLCALPAMAAAGVASVKIAGREAPTERKLRSVELVRRVLERVADGADAAAVACFAQGLRKVPERCASGYMCYYPEVAPTEHAAP